MLGAEAQGDQGALISALACAAPLPLLSSATMPELISSNSTLKKKTREIITLVRHYLLK